MQAVAAKHWTPWPYQVTAAQHALYNPGCGIFARPGLGKTTVSLAVVDTLKKHKAARAALVIAPLRPVYNVWPKEARKWADFNHMTVGVLHGKDKNKVLRESHDVYVMNPEGLEWLAAELAKLVAAGQPVPFDVFISDESTKFKNPKSGRSKKLASIMRHFARVILLTGTPTANRLEDIFGQMLLIDGGARLGKYITHFRREYFDAEDVYIGGGRTVTKWHPRADTAERIKAAISDVCIYVEDTLGREKPLQNIIELELPKALRATYAELEDVFVTKLSGNKTLTVATAAAASMKLRQFCGGLVYDEDQRTHAVHTLKLDALCELVAEQNGDPLLVGVGFVHEARAIQKRLKEEFGIDAPYVSDLSPKAGAELEDRWNRGEIPVVLAHPDSVAYGLNMQDGGAALVWFTLPWSEEQHDQFNKRLDRQGQLRLVVQHYLIVKDTIDEHVYATLTARQNQGQNFLNLLKKGYV